MRRSYFREISHRAGSDSKGSRADLVSHRESPGLDGTGQDAPSAVRALPAGMPWRVAPRRPRENQARAAEPAAATGVFGVAGAVPRASHVLKGSRQPQELSFLERLRNSPEAALLARGAPGFRPARCARAARSP